MAFVRCTAPFKQLIYEDDWGEVRWLDEHEEAVLTRIAATFGYEIEEIGQ